MNTPRFNAEASLYATSEHYRIVGSFRQGNGTIRPSQIPPIGDGDGGLSCFSRCIQNCLSAGGDVWACPWLCNERCFRFPLL
jgi:hypothetical protein